MRNRLYKFSVFHWVSRTLSVVLHPVLMPVYILYLLFHIPSWFLLIPAGVKGYCYLVTLFMLVLLPLACLPLLRYFHLIRNFRLEDKHDRIYPILTVVFFCLFGVLVAGADCLYGYCAAVVSGDDYPALSLFGDYAEVENQYAHDGDRRGVRFFTGFGLEVFRGCAEQFYDNACIGRPAGFQSAVFKETYPLAGLSRLFARSGFRNGDALTISSLCVPRCLADP